MHIFHQPCHILPFSTNQNRWKIDFFQISIFALTVFHHYFHILSTLSASTTVIYPDDDRLLASHRRLYLCAPKGHSINPLSDLFVWCLIARFLWCADLQTPLPEYPTLATNNIVLKLRAREANDIFFRELSSVLQAVQGTIESPVLAPLAAALMPAVLEETKVKLTLKQLLDSCK